MTGGEQIIKCWLKGRQGTVILDPSNPYKITLSDAGHLDAFYFGTKIFKSNGQLVDQMFDYCEDIHAHVYEVCGGKQVCVYHNRIELHDGGEILSISFPSGVKLFYPQKMTSHQTDCVSVHASLNGVALQIRVSEPTLTMRIETTSAYPKLRMNDRYCAWMRQDFVPFVYLSALYGINDQGVPSSVEYTLYKKNDKQFDLVWSGFDKIKEYVIEINFHEQKLFQDTTVESINPNVNSVYGASAFIGHTERYGTQWLFSKTTFPILEDLRDKRLSQVIWHIPVLHTATNGIIEMHPLARRFCSFGTTWMNRVSENNQTAINFESQLAGYLSADVTALYRDDHTGTLKYFDGNLLRLSSDEKHEYTLITTGDSSMYPHILEVRLL